MRTRTGWWRVLLVAMVAAVSYGALGCSAHVHEHDHDRDGADIKVKGDVDVD
jgi:hypothetical protein